MQFNKNTSSGKKSITGLVIKSILFNKKTIPRTRIKARANFIIKPIKLILELVFFINCI